MKKASDKIIIPVILVGVKNKEKVQILLPSNALTLLNKTEEEEVTYLGESEFCLSIQKLVDLAITHEGFFEALDIAIDSEPHDRWLERLIERANELPEN